MQTHHLRAFLVLADELNFHRAAERLSLSQPGLSDQIRQLERQLGTRLFTRGRSGTTLTPAGVGLLPWAGDAVKAVDDLEGRARAATRRSPLRPDGRRLRVGLLGNGVGEATWSILRDFHQARPDVALDLRPMGFVEAFCAIDHDLADVVFVIGPAGPSDRQRVVTVGQEPVGVLQSADIPGDTDAWDLEVVVRRLTYGPPPTMDPTFTRFWTQADVRSRSRSHLSPLRPPPDGRSLPTLVDQAGRDGALTLWPLRLPVGAASGCLVRPILQSLHAPRQVLARRGGDHVDELVRVLGRHQDSEAEVPGEHRG